MNVVGAVVILGLIAFLVWPKSPQIPRPNLQDKDLKASDIRVTYTGQDISLPKNLPLYTLTGIVNQDEVFPRTAASLQLERHPQVRDIYWNNDRTKTLTKIAGTLFLSYADDSIQPSVGLIPTEEQAQRDAEEFLSRLGYTTSELTLLKEATRFVAVKPGDEDYVDVPKGSSTLIILEYQRQLEGIPVILGTTPVSSIELMVTAKGVHKATLPIQSFRMEKDVTLTLLSQEKLLDQLRKGTFTVMGSLGALGDTPQERVITQLELSSVQVEYRVITEHNRVLPYVRFSGTATVQSGQTAPITLITPAVETTP